MIETLADERDLETALACTSALLFKHSPICSVSGRARRELLRFCERHPEVSVYEIDVIG